MSETDIGAPSTGLGRRTLHACEQCRSRKQKCGGVTAQATCLACQSRQAICSFENEATDPRYNPFLRIQSIPARSSVRSDSRSPPPRGRSGVASGNASRQDRVTSVEQQVSNGLTVPVYDGENGAGDRPERRISRGRQLGGSQAESSLQAQVRELQDRLNAYERTPRRGTQLSQQNVDPIRLDQGQGQGHVAIGTNPAQGDQTSQTNTSNRVETVRNQVTVGLASLQPLSGSQQPRQHQQQSQQQQREQQQHHGQHQPHEQGPNRNTSQGSIPPYVSSEQQPFQQVYDQEHQNAPPYDFTTSSISYANSAPIPLPDVSPIWTNNAISNTVYQPAFQPTFNSPSRPAALNSTHSVGHVQPPPRAEIIDSDMPQSVGAESATFEGPLRTLQSMNAGSENTLDVEVHDPIASHVITEGQAMLAFQIYFTYIHANAPFLDPTHDSDMHQVRSRSVALFLNIVAVGARYWSHASRKDSWLLPSYPKLLKVLDAEMFRLAFRSRPADTTLETVQALMIYSHWMPVDHDNSGYRSRFRESTIFQCLGQAIRWAVLLGLEQSAHLPFIGTSKDLPTAQQVRAFRTMLYLAESDHYLALSAHRAPTLAVSQIFTVLPRFLQSQWSTPTDYRLAALLKVVQAKTIIGNTAQCEEDVQAFKHDVDVIERHVRYSYVADDREFTAAAAKFDSSFDKMGQHFPYTSLRWYRLSYACTLLPSASDWSLAGEPFHLCVEWATQILLHLSSALSTTPLHVEQGSSAPPLEPDADVVRLLSFAIDQYFVVITYTAAFLVLAWQSNAMDNHLRSRKPQFQNQSDPRSSPLYRLVDLAARTMKQCSPQKGHLTTRYIEFLYLMAERVAAEPVTMLATQDLSGVSATNPIWDQDWLNLWQTSGLEQGWLFAADATTSFNPS